MRIRAYDEGRMTAIPNLQTSQCAVQQAEIGRGCVKTILGTLTSQKTHTTVTLLGTRYLRAANESILAHVLFSSREFSHGLGPDCVITRQR